MVMANLKITPRNFHDEATLSVQIAPPTGFSITNTQNTQRGRVWRSVDGTNQYWSGTYDDALPRTASAFSLFRHRCRGGNVRLQLYSDAAWTTQVYDSTALPVSNISITEGLDWGINPYGEGNIDPFATEAPYWLYFNETQHLSYRVTFSSNVSTYGYAYWQICRVYLGLHYELPYTALYDFPINYVDRTDRNRSRGGSLRTNTGQDWKTMTLEIKRVPAADGPGWLDIMHYLKTGKDFVLDLYPGEDTRRRRDHFIDCKFSQLDPLLRFHPEYLSKRIQIEEV
jgi:hypothetical protein